MTIIEKWRKSLDTFMQMQSSLISLIYLTTLIMNLTKLNVCGLDTFMLKFIYPYLRGRIQRTNISSSNSSFAEILLRVTKGSILGPPIFNAYTWDLFYDIDELDLASFADDNTPYSCLSHISSVLGKLKGGIDTTFHLLTKEILK